METPQDPNHIVTLIGAGITGLLTGGLWLRRKLSRDATEIANDRAEIDMIQRLQTENVELRVALGEVTEERNKLYREVGEMVGSIRALEASQEQMKQQVEQLTRQIVVLQGALERTGHERRTT